MKINFYETRLSEDDRTMLVKEKVMNYETVKVNNPEAIAVMMRKLRRRNVMSERLI